MRIEEYQQRLQPLLAPLGGLYSGVMRLRRGLYERGVLSSWRAGVPVVSVGNIGWGGTGKTPITDWLLEWASRQGLAPLVLTRGYGARPGEYPHLVRPGNLAEEAGDEPLMLCRRHPQASILVDPARSRAGRWAEQNLDAGVIFLDDGFQHLGVRRDLDLVLFRPSDLGRGWGRVIPAGSWREGPSALRRAHAFLVKSSPKRFEELAARMKHRLDLRGRSVFSFEMRVQGMVNVLDGAQRLHLGQQPYLLVTGVGEPKQVERTAARHLGYAPREHLVYPDHHAYTRSDVQVIEQAAERRHCAFVVCTPKDAVKLGPLAREHFWTFDLDVSFGPTWNGHDLQGASFDAWFDARFDKIKAGRPPRKRREDDETKRQRARRER